MQGELKLTATLKHDGDRWQIIFDDIPYWLANDLYENHRTLRWSGGSFPTDHDAPCSVHMEAMQAPASESEDANE